MCLILEDVFSYWDERINKIKLFSPSNSVNKMYFSIIASATLLQISALLRQSFEKNLKGAHFYVLPGNNGNNCEIKYGDMKRMENDINVYHKDIGIIDDDDDDENKILQRKRDIKVRFLKGQTITPEALRLHELEPPVYVERKEMREIKKMIDEELSHRKVFSEYKHGYKGIFTLEHDPGAGGSSCGRYLLYVFKEKYPCIEITKVSSNTVKYLKSIHEQTKSPLLIIMDLAHFDKNENTPITDFVRQLENIFVTSLVVIIDRRHSEQNIKKDLYFYLKTTLNPNDIEQFRKVYDESNKWIQNCKESTNGCKTVFQFGLFTFLNENERIAKHVLDCTNLASEIELRILRVICYLRKYGKIETKISVFLKYLFSEEQQVDYNEKLLMESLKNVQDFIVCNKRIGFEYCKLASDCLNDLLMERFSEKIPICKENENSQMYSFIIDLFELLSKDFKERADSFVLVQELFIMREKTEQEKEYFSLFINDFTIDSGKNIVSETIKKFIGLFPSRGSGAHLRAMHARYLMYKCNKLEEAIEEIKLAVGASKVPIDDPSATHDTVLLHNYGHLIVYKAKYDFEKSKDKIYTGLKQFEEIVKEAIKAYQKGQSLGPPYNAYLFIGEVQARHDLLSNYLKYKCNNKPQELNKLCASEGSSFLKECRIKAEELLQQLEYIIDTEQISNVNELGKTYWYINLLKWNLIKLHCDSEPNAKSLEKLPYHIPCDIGSLIFKCYYQNNICSFK